MSSEKVENLQIKTDAPAKTSSPLKEDAKKVGDWVKANPITTAASVGFSIWVIAIIIWVGTGPIGKLARLLGDIIGDAASLAISVVDWFERHLILGVLALLPLTLLYAWAKGYLKFSGKEGLADKIIEQRKKPGPDGAPSLEQLQDSDDPIDKIEFEVTSRALAKATEDSMNGTQPSNDWEAAIKAEITSTQQEAIRQTDPDNPDKAYDDFIKDAAERARTAFVGE